MSRDARCKGTARSNNCSRTEDNKRMEKRNISPPAESPLSHLLPRRFLCIKPKREMRRMASMRSCFSFFFFFCLCCVCSRAGLLWFTLVLYSTRSRKSASLKWRPCVALYVWHASSIAHFPFLGSVYTFTFFLLSCLD